MASVRQRVHRLAVIIGTALWVALPVVVIVVAQRRAATLEIDPPATTWTDVVRSTEPTRQDLTIGLWWHDADSIYLPAMAGAVEQVRVRVGDAVHDLDRPLVVAGVERVAVRSPAPFFRPLTNGDSGRDVEWLNAALARLDLDGTPGESFTNATQRGVEAFARSIGAGTQATFDPAWVLFVPSDRFVVASVALSVGQPAPAAGTPVITGVRQIERATTDEFTGSSEPGVSAPGQPGEPPSASSLHLSPITVAAGATVSVAGTALRLDPSRGAVDAADLHILEGLVAPLAPQVAAVASSPQMDISWRVPVAATFERRDGGTCVLRRRGRGAEAVRVELRSTSVGAAVVSGPLHGGDRVAVPVPVDRRRC